MQQRQTREPWQHQIQDNRVVFDVLGLVQTGWTVAHRIDNTANRLQPIDNGAKQFGLIFDDQNSHRQSARTGMQTPFYHFPVDVGGKPIDVVSLLVLEVEVVAVFVAIDDHERHAQPGRTIVV